MTCTSCGTRSVTAQTVCPVCGSALTPAVPGAEDTAPRKRSRIVGWVLFPLVLLAGMGVFLLFLNPSLHSVIRDQPVVAGEQVYDTTGVPMTDIRVREEGGDLVFPLDDLLRHRLVRFEVRTPTTVRPVLAYLGTDGRLITAISVSEHCGSTRFLIRGNEIHCAQCASRWNMMTMEAYSCCAKYYPDPIPSRVSGGEVRVPRVFVDKWAGRM